MKEDADSKEELKEVDVDMDIEDDSDNENEQILLKEVNIINGGAYTPNEIRGTGWILKNISRKGIDVKADLVRLNDDSQVKVETDHKIDIQLKTNQDIFVLLSVVAPNIAGEYLVSYQLKNDKQCVSDRLDLPVVVKPVFDTKEDKIQKIMQMGFSNRMKVVGALTKCKWDESKAANWLASNM